MMKNKKKWKSGDINLTLFHIAIGFYQTDTLNFFLVKSYKVII